MKIKLPQALLEKLDNKLLQRMGCQNDRRSWQKFEEIELMGVDPELLKELQIGITPFAPKGDNRIKGALKTLKKIKTWLQALDIGLQSDIKCKNAEHFWSLAIGYLAKVAGHRVFIHDDERDFDACYYVEEVTYHPKVKHRDWISPAYVSFDLFWVEFGGRKNRRISFSGQECRGRTVGEVLVNRGILIETMELRTAYLEERDRFHKDSANVGKQFLASGFATDDVDGNDKVVKGWWRDTASINLDKDGIRSNVVTDVFRESDAEDRDSDSDMNPEFWKKFEAKEDIEIEEEEDDEDAIDEEDSDDEEEEGQGLALKSTIVEVPLHPLMVVFDLKKHRRLKVHIAQLEDYKYDKSLGDKLILPKENHDLVETLLAHNLKGYKDVVKGKGQGAIILCVGPAGTGKTLTSEVFAEVSSRPLYTVQCSQLGTQPDDLEEELLKIFARAQRWKAILLLDEADVYIRERGNDLQQNAIVGVFLRTLEYYNGIMFMTTNRPDIVDDAIASRCIARVTYTIPTPQDQERIWKVLATTAKVTIDDKEMKKIIDKHMDLSGRDIKNLLKLAIMVSVNKKEPITAELISQVKRFKPTSSENKGDKA